MENIENIEKERGGLLRRVGLRTGGQSGVVQSEKRALSRRYLENYFSGVWKSIASGDNDHREGGRRGERANLSDRRCPHSRAPLFLSLSLSLPPSLSPFPAPFDRVHFSRFACLFIR
jgi:hypothetical protein